ncbi:DUF2797 domain-containing protein [Halocatena marina]|uniref:DUF2797 domain-containing protein n=1 Tax=Halocatena marina TaxID=2934937 RepID=A0ABD5YVB0_9EURY|nr:DUF2797 domain-containing protein [Halocatena marina]
MQVVGYRLASQTLLIASDAVEAVSLAPGTKLEYTLGERHCAGHLTSDGHIACKNDGSPYCDAHTQTWVCARCTGTCLKDEMDCYEAHAVYLAAFAPATFKVGVTRLDRLSTRLQEQGADRAAHIHTVSNGRIAREIEADIADEITDRVRIPTKISGLHRTVDESAWNELLAEHDPLDTFTFEYGLDLRSQPIPETLATGTVQGVKGRILVLDRSEGRYAVDLRDLVGYELIERASERSVQSDLSAF